MADGTVGPLSAASATVTGPRRFWALRSTPAANERPAGEIPRPASAARTTTLTARAGLLAVCLLAFGMGSVGITDEGYLSLHGDVPKYLMNGVYLLDMARDFPFASPEKFLEHARLYYARYPALSLGHHPPLLPVAEAPLYALFGVSVRSARIATLFSFIAAVAFLYLLVNDIFGGLAAVFAAVFFATSPFTVFLTQSVLSELPTLALVTASAYFLHRFCMTERRSALIAFVAAATLSLYAKQLAIFVFPAFFLTALATLGIKRMLKRDVLVAAGTMAVLALPIVAITLILSRTNLTAPLGAFHEPGPRAGNLVRSALHSQLTVAVVLLAAAGAARALFARDRRSLLFLFWVPSVFAGVLLGGTMSEAERYSIYWVPAFCALAGSLAAGWRSQISRTVVVALLLAAAASQGLVAARVRLPRADGYEEAARFVVESQPGPTVMFSGDIDTGYFTFFVRKHDPARQLVVLRADKVLTTSFMGHVSVEDRIQSPAEIYDVLRKFGTRYIVVETRPSESRVLEWLRHELQSSNFVERRRIPIITSDFRLTGTSLLVYEFIGAVPPDKDAVLDLHLPIVRQSVSVRLSDLIARKSLR